MGLPAVKVSHDARHVRPHLRVVHSQGKPRTRKRRQTCASRETFAVVCVLLAGLALFGLGRVMLAARATEASIRSSQLRDEIKAEQLVGDLLEIDMSALAVPSRIENIAGTSMQMAEAASVEYMELPADTEMASADAINDVTDATSRQSDAVSEGDGIGSMLSSIMEMAAGEAQVLLVGDVGLASSE